MSRRVLLGSGVALAGAAGYYLYNAGGDPKVAEKSFEHDAAKVGSSLKGEKVSGQEAKKAGEEWAQRAGAKLDSTVGDVKTKISQTDKKIQAKAGEAETKLDQLKHDSAAQFDKTRKDASKEVDKFDKTVEKKAADAKSGISSWFGFGGK